ncbi:MAG: 3-dehydroquinate synthase [Planctomycetota bacterium]
MLPKPFLTIKTAAGSCPVYVGSGILKDIHSLAFVRAASERAAIADATTARLFAKKLNVSKTNETPNVIFTFPAGEKNKNLRTVSNALEFLASHRLDRKSIIIGLGGGVVTDVAGLVASMYLRGVSWIAAPTTLLGMVDAAIGGKTGVDLKSGKNLAGSFWPPSAIVIDFETLASLPRRERSGGFAEMIKIALACDADFFEYLEKHGEALLTCEPKQCERAIRWSIQLKAGIVESDERDHGARRILNLGHTTAHALEAATNYRKFHHGEAVAIGLRVACEAAVVRGTMDISVKNRVVELLQKVKLPFSWPHGVDIQKALELTASDKKIINRKLTFILPAGIGGAEIVTLDPRELKNAIERSRV